MENEECFATEKNSRWHQFRKRMGGIALFTGAVLLPMGALVLELTTRLCVKFSGFIPLATPYHIMMVAFVCMTLLVLWVTVRGNARVQMKWFCPLALGIGITMIFCALFMFLIVNYILAATPLPALWLALLITLIPPMVLAYTPLFALVSGIVLFRRFNRMAKQKGVFIIKSFYLGILVGLAVVFTFFATGSDTNMVEDILPKPSWKKDATQIDTLYEKSKQGDREAPFRIALCYATGHGIDTNIEKAIEWYTKAYWQGFSPASCFIERHYRGCKPSWSSGLFWCNRILYRGDVRFQFHQGLRYAHSDIITAVKWLKKAAENGHPTSQLLLNRYSETGTITSNDINDIRQMILTMASQYEEASN